jgi:hypothetical protein
MPSLRRGAGSKKQKKHPTRTAIRGTIHRFARTNNALCLVRPCVLPATHVILSLYATEDQDELRGLVSSERRERRDPAQDLLYHAMSRSILF